MGTSSKIAYTSETIYDSNFTILIGLLSFSQHTIQDGIVFLTKVYTTLSQQVLMFGRSMSVASESNNFSVAKLCY